MNRDDTWIVLRSAGMFPGQALKVDVARHVCADILDGIGVRIEGTPGGFVVSWEDFKRAYEANVEVRKTLAPPATSIDELFRTRRIDL